MCSGLFGRVWKEVGGRETNRDYLSYGLLKSDFGNMAQKLTPEDLITRISGKYMDSLTPGRLTRGQELQG